MPSRLLLARRPGPQRVRHRRSPGGSSSGSGTAAAAGLAAITIGTETSGSIISPRRRRASSACARPSAWSAAPGSCRSRPRRTRAGPMTRTVADAAAELQAIAGRDPEDPATAGRAARCPTTSAGARRGRARGHADRRGHQQRRRATTPPRSPIAGGRRDAGPDHARAAERPPSILTYEFKRDLNAYLAGCRRRRADAIARRTSSPSPTRTRSRRRSSANLRADEARTIDLADPATNAAYVDQPRRGAAPSARQHRRRARPRHGGPRRRPRGDHDAGGTLTGIGARAGYPQLTVPAGYTATQRRPVNISFNGTRVQRGDAARARLRVRAGDAAARAAERRSTRRCTAAPTPRRRASSARTRARPGSSCCTRSGTSRGCRSRSRRRAIADLQRADGRAAG